MVGADTQKIIVVAADAASGQTVTNEPRASHIGSFFREQTLLDFGCKFQFPAQPLLFHYAIREM